MLIRTELTWPHSVCENFSRLWPCRKFSYEEILTENLLKMPAQYFLSPLLSRGFGYKILNAYLQKK